jgi:hypothetical protein
METPQTPQTAPIWIRGTIAVGAGLKAKLEQAAAPQGCDADYPARRILRDHLDRHPTPQSVGSSK